MIENISYRELVAEQRTVPCLRIAPVQLMSSVMNVLRGSCFVHRKVRCVITEGETKIVLLDPAVISLDGVVESLPNYALLRALKTTTLSKETFVVNLNYTHFTMVELLKKVLPEAVTPLSGFEQVGHIAHVNLSKEHEPFKHMIGQVILDTNPTVRTVVNKLDSISSVFREFKMEVLAGESNRLEAEVMQYGCRFFVPYDKVYWNSRLAHEHARLTEMMLPDDELFDVMAGVGPFAVPAALNGVIVHANDLNPASYLAMQKNRAINNAKFDTYNMDGRDFVEMAREKYLEISLPRRRRHFVMNLPALAVTFLDVFRRPHWTSGKVKDTGFVVHCYTFSAAADPLLDAVLQCEAVLRYSLDGCVEGRYLVRDVSPQKQMVCVSFHLPRSLLSCENDDDGTGAAKKIRLEK